MKKETYTVTGMHCASCKNNIEKSVNSIDGVSQASINLASEKMSVSFEDNIDFEIIKNAVESAGSYSILKKDIDENEKIKQYKILKKKIILVSILSIPFLIIMIAMFLDQFNVINISHAPLGHLEITKTYHLNIFYLLQFIFATPIVFWGGNQFFSSAYSALKSKTTNMDTLISLGTLSAWIFSSCVTFFPNLFKDITVESFFEVSVFVVLFILIGRLLESKAKAEANDAIKKLFELQVKNATILKDNKEVIVPIEDVQIGDILIAKPGDKIAVDGVIVEGTSTLDESMITGESIPVSKSIGNQVIGSTLNTSSFIKYKAEKIGSDTMLFQIIKMVEEAQGSVPPIQKLADRISKVFVPIVISLSVLTFIFWYFIAPSFDLTNNSNTLQLAFYTATTVLIIACPCALGLATPTAIMVSSGKASKLGILIKDISALEQMNKVNTIVFDKTGTLTKGHIDVTNFEYVKNIEKNTILSIAYSIEKLSNHPLSNAITKFVKPQHIDDTIEVKDFVSLEGKGVVGSVDKKQILLGNKKLLDDYSIALNSNLEEKTNKFVKDGKSIIYMSIDNNHVGTFLLADTIKTNAKEIIKTLKQNGIKVVMLSGDNKITANAIGKELGIDEVFGDVLPMFKISKIKKLQKDNIVAMVGDGINDAPALVKANVGIAMGTGTDIAVASGDIIIVNGDLFKILNIFKISKQTLSTIRQNLTWAFGYNLIAIPVATGILYPTFNILISPIIASAAMAFSSLSVVLNSLRIKRSKNKF